MRTSTTVIFTVHRKPFILVYDNFNTGVNDATLAGRAPIIRPNANNWAVGSGTFVSNLGKAEARFAASSPALLTHDMDETDVDIHTDFVLPSTGNNRAAGIVFRYINTNNYLYTVASPDNSLFRLLARVAAATLVLDEIPAAFTANQKYRMRAAMVGNEIYASIPGIGELTVDLVVYDAENTTTLVSTFATAELHGLRAANQVGGGVISHDRITVLPVTQIPVGDNFLMEDGSFFAMEDGSLMRLE